MSEEKPKYVRKKCEHNKYKHYCAECGGAAICQHKCIKYRCKECKGNKLCEHNLQKYYCKLCGGKGVCIHDKTRHNCRICKASNYCEHDKLKYICNICKGSRTCEHNKELYYCKLCGGKGICEHNKYKRRCTICNPSLLCLHNKIQTTCVECATNNNIICEHNKRKYRCIECNGKGICPHKKVKEKCIPCKGSSICIHNKIRAFCFICKGSQTCPHKKRKSHCKQCGGSALCKSSWCETVANAKYDGYCLYCFAHLFPDKPIVRNYKTKEKAVADFVLQEFPLEKYTWVTDKRVQEGCSRKRPDLFLDLGYQIIIVEIDENQHAEYDCSCENKRLMELSQDVGHRPIIFIRFNPDDYVTTEKKITSCWSVNKTGLCAVKKTKQKEWDNRLEALKTSIHYWCQPENKTDKMIEMIHLFYDETI